MRRMKKFEKNLRLCLVVLGLFFFALVSAQAEVADQDREVHAPILIRGNEGFLLPGSGVSSGSGTAADPYIIEDWEIDASAADGIHIVDTHAHFVVRNCLVENGGGFYRGMNLQNVQNGRVENNTSVGNVEGIFLRASNDNIITHNRILNSSRGIRLYSSDNNTLTENRLDLYGNYGEGISLSDSFTNRVLKNVVRNSYGFGILLSGASHNSLTGNDSSDNSYGITLCWGSESNTVDQNIVMNNYFEGIELSYSGNNTIDGNIVLYSGEIGISLLGTINNTISNNTASNNLIGINIASGSNDNIFKSNVINSNTHIGISMGEASNNRISNNAVERNSYCGLYFSADSVNNLIFNNIFRNAANVQDYGANIWNIAPRLGINIVRGPYLGGNYWSDYTGIDTNGDWLGDTELPHNSSGGIANGGDWHPLIIPTTLPDVEELNLGPIQE